MLFRSTPPRAALAALLVLSVAGVAQAQTPKASVDCAALNAADHTTMDHAAHAALLKACKDVPAVGRALPSQAGQAAYGAIAEIVRLLESDPTTDWAKVNIEALRQHLIDMDDVTLRTSVVQTNVPGGLQADISGRGATVAAIRRMVLGHGKMLDATAEYRTQAEETQDGARLVVMAENLNDARVIAMIRGLGFAGLMTVGDHHAPHHIALARGVANPHGQ